MNQDKSLTNKKVANIERAFVNACLDQGITDNALMVIMATHTLRHLNKDVVAGYKAAKKRRANLLKRKW